MSYTNAQIDAYLAALRQAESGDNYRRNHRGQLGAYGIMSNQWNDWAAQAGYGGIAWHDAAAQDAVAKFKFKQYLQRWGTWDLALVAWFAGPQAADQAADLGVHALRDYRDPDGVSVEQFVDSVNDVYEEPEDLIPNSPAQLPPTDQLAFDQARRPGRAPSQGYKPQPGIPGRDPTADFYEIFATEAKADQQQPGGEMAGMLAAMLNTMSNAVAGGSRTNVGATVDIAPLEVEERA